MKVDPSVVAARLSRAKDFLGWNGWTRNHNIRQEDDGTYSYCIGGAVLFGAFDKEEYHNIEWHSIYWACNQALDDAATRLTGQKMYFQNYNDGFAQTKEEALALFDNAIRELQEAV